MRCFCWIAVVLVACGTTAEDDGDDPYRYPGINLGRDKLLDVDAATFPEDAGELVDTGAMVEPDTPDVVLQDAGAAELDAGPEELVNAGDAAISVDHCGNEDLDRNGYLDACDAVLWAATAVDEQPLDLGFGTTGSEAELQIVLEAGTETFTQDAFRAQLSEQPSESNITEVEMNLLRAYLADGKSIRSAIHLPNDRVVAMSALETPQLPPGSQLRRVVAIGWASNFDVSFRWEFRGRP